VRVHVFVAGDFYCQLGTRFSDIRPMTHLVKDNNMVITDMSHLNGVVTYCNDASTSMSWTWIDHILCNSIVKSLVRSAEVLHNYVTSDHEPVMVYLTNLVSCQ